MYVLEGSVPEKSQSKRSKLDKDELGQSISIIQKYKFPVIGRDPSFITDEFFDPDSLIFCNWNRVSLFMLTLGIGIEEYTE